MRRAAYRVRQLWRSLLPTLSAEEVRAARAQLGEQELRLFLAMGAWDRRQAIDVMRWLQQRADPSDDLLKAALLHDAGKGFLRGWERVAFVLLEAASPRLLDRLAAESGAGWRNALWRLRHHARLGAALLVDAGSRARVVELVARHGGPDGGSSQSDEELAWLRAADSAC